MKVTVAVNGTDYTREVEPRLLLSDFLRQELGLTGTHVGCEHGVWGACPVLAGGRAIRSVGALAGEKKELSVVDDQVGSPTWTVDLGLAIKALEIADEPAEPEFELKPMSGDATVLVVEDNEMVRAMMVELLEKSV